MEEAKISLEEREEIFAILRRYLWCMDTGNIDRAKTNFTTDATVRDVTGKMWDTAAGGVTAFARHFLAAPDRPATQHWIQHMSVQDAGGGEILVISYWAAIAWENGSDTKTVRVIGCYRDTCVKTNGKWLIREKIIEPWNASNVPALSALI